ncbi:E3 ubiquitin-protein ligase [Phytophthora cinnamomi]|uniref:E3 ubiquitin-protein ligase n=1 Tax=Phytophthora cinnamomi TaxID=4785 RepID=UPI00355A8ACC|nr:E3 ubiquitin-protein ligase [Phytophthora cinnamomi]
MEPPARSKRKPSPSGGGAPGSSKRQRRQPRPPAAPASAAAASSPAAAHKPRPKLKTRRAPPSSSSSSSSKPRAAATTATTAPPQQLKPKRTRPKAVEQLTLFSRYADPSVTSPKPQPPSRRPRRREEEATAPAAVPLTSTGGGEGVVDLEQVPLVASLETVEGDDILQTLLRASTPRVKRRFPSEEALTSSEKRERETLRRRRIRIRSEYSAMKQEQPREEGGEEFKTPPQSPELQRNLFEVVEQEEVEMQVQVGVEDREEERAQLEEEEAETDEETTESKIQRLSKVMHMNWRQFFLWLMSGALLLCAMVVAAPLIKKLLEPPLPYCDSEWIDANDGSFVLADPADHFDRSKALQPFISSTAMAARPMCQPCPVYGNCLNGSVISCAPPYVLQYGLCKEDPEVQQSLDQLALGIQKFVVEKAAKNACDNVSLWSYLTSDGDTEPSNGLTASIEVLVSDVQVFVTRTISFGKAVSMLPREYVFNRALDMALRNLKDIFVTEDQSQLVVGGGVVPWSCRAKHQLYSHIKLIAVAVALGTALVFSYRQFLLYRTERQLVDRFVKEVRFFLLDRTRRIDRFYPVDHLRDDLFEKQSLQDRTWLCKSVWPKVAAVVNDDSRITTRLMRVRGEDLVVWEWASSASPSHRRPAGGRVSLGTITAIDTQSEYWYKSMD